MNRDEIQSALEKHGLGDLSSEIMPMAAPSIRLTTRPVDLANLPAGASRLGGLPDIPEPFDWPAGLSFIGQINLAEMSSVSASLGLPGSGWLYFFYDVEN